MKLTLTKNGSFLPVLNALYNQWDIEVNITKINIWLWYCTGIIGFYALVVLPIKTSASMSYGYAIVVNALTGFFMFVVVILSKYLKTPFDNARPFNVADHTTWIKDTLSLIERWSDQE